MRNEDCVLCVCLHVEGKEKQPEVTKNKLWINKYERDCINACDITDLLHPYLDHTRDSNGSFCHSGMSFDWWLTGEEVTTLQKCYWWSTDVSDATKKQKNSASEVCEIKVWTNRLFKLTGHGNIVHKMSINSNREMANDCVLSPATLIIIIILNGTKKIAWGRKT